MLSFSCSLNETLKSTYSVWWKHFSVLHLSLMLALKCFLLVSVQSGGIADTQSISEGGFSKWAAREFVYRLFKQFKNAFTAPLKYGSVG
jgi:hypothetical protein